MILIDTSAWIQFLRPRGLPALKERVAAYLSADEGAFTCPIRFELLSGARDSESDDVEAVLALCRHVPFDAECWTAAAGVERELRKRGVSVPRDDVFVATVALRTKMAVLCQDSHFDLIRDKGGLSLVVERLS